MNGDYSPGLNGLPPVINSLISKPFSFCSAKVASIKGLVPFLRGTTLKLYSVLRPVPSHESTKSQASKSE